MDIVVDIDDYISKTTGSARVHVGKNPNSDLIDNQDFDQVDLKKFIDHINLSKNSK